MKRRRPVLELAAAPDYREWTREQLIDRLHVLEGRPAERRGKGRSQRPFDFAAYPRCHVALKIAYFGWEYNGFASQKSYKEEAGGEERGDVGVVTVEDVLFQALLRTRLIESPRTCRYSRCGRTDAGVSSVGQVVALTLRSSARKLGPEPVAEPSSVEVPLCSMLNRNLPPEIRVLGWCPVSEDFDARFSCRGRSYKYFFPRLGLDLAAMQEAAAKLVGEHDFRNFARRDPNRPKLSTIRRIFTSHIVERDGGMCEYVIHGTAFLYHQVRCTMEILLRIGRGTEPVSIIDDLLDVVKVPVVPSYELASEIPLVLTNCHYDEELPFVVGDADHAGEKEGERTAADIFALWSELQAKTMTVALLRGQETEKSPFVRKSHTPTISNHIKSLGTDCTS